ncbi:hypothetical protein MalM25_07650 [Planctomycetes bacterium MalM25]|nr:hypothetical protein MalM25_07650 [Planctomycetes bacterium MalM25]
MEHITRNAIDLDAKERDALEHLLGAPLTDQQQVIVYVKDRRVDERGESSPPQTAADYGILGDVPDAEIKLLTEAMTQRSLS